MEQKKLMQFLIAGKLVLVVCAFALYQGWIQIGDLPSFAADPEKSEKTEQKDEKASDKETAKDDKAAKEGGEADKKEEDDPATKKRKSFLSDLFELPKLDPQKAQKQEVGKYLDLADRKGRQISEREAMLAKKEQQLKDLELSIDQKLAKLDDERKFIAKTLQQEKDLKSERLDKLVELYDKMEPKKAAPQFEKIDQDLAVALFKRLKQKQVTTILEFMSADKSVALAEYFGRVKSGREYDLLKELNSSLKKEFQDCKGMPDQAIAADDKSKEKTADKAKEADKAAGKSADTKTAAGDKASDKADDKAVGDKAAAH